MIITAWRKGLPTPENCWFDVWSLKEEVSEARPVNLPDEEVREMLEGEIGKVQKKVYNLLYNFD